VLYLLAVKYVKVSFCGVILDGLPGLRRVIISNASSFLKKKDYGVRPCQNGCLLNWNHAKSQDIQIRPDPRH